MYGISNEDYLKSLEGKSAYEVWLDNGNTGTQEDYLKSLEGKSAYDIWLEAGHEGTIDDFIAYMCTASWETF